MVTYPSSDTATVIINNVAAEVGLTPVTDPFAANDQNFTQLTYLINAAGEELRRMHNWQVLVREETFTTAAADVGNYPLPSDFQSIINETMWDLSDQEPIFGPLNAQEWALLRGQDTATLADLYFRIQDGEFWLYPSPVGAVKNCSYEYQSLNWVLENNGTTYKRSVETGTDKPIFDSLLMRKYLKVKWLIAKGLDATAAQDDFNQLFSIIAGEDKGGRVIDAGGAGRYPYLNAYRNVRDTGFGG